MTFMGLTLGYVVTADPTVMVAVGELKAETTPGLKEAPVDVYRLYTIASFGSPVIPRLFEKDVNVIVAVTSPSEYVISGMATVVITGFRMVMVANAK